MAKLDNNKTVLLRDTVHQTSLGESAAADSPRHVWWNVSRNYTVLFLSRDVKSIKFNQYLLVVFMSLNMSNSTFRKLVLFWMWHHGRALWRRGSGAWHNRLFLMTASNVNCWADVTNRVTRLWQGDIENFARSRASYGQYHGLELPNHGINEYNIRVPFINILLYIISRNRLHHSKYLSRCQNPFECFCSLQK